MVRFGQVFKTVSDGLNAETSYVGEDGRRRLKATPQQIAVLVIAPFSPVLLYQIFKAIKGM